MDEKLDIINPEDKDYYDGKFYMVGLYPGAGVELATFYVYAGCEEEALELVVAYLDMQPTESNLLYTTEEIENYISESFADEFQEYMQDNPDADTFQFATDYLGYFYVDATMHGASQPYFVEGNNLRVEETNDEPIVFENKEVKEENKTEDYWDATEIDRDLFLSLMKFNFGTDSKGNNYIITADGNDIKRFYAKNDAEALRVYNDVKAKWNYDDHPDLTMNIGSIAPREESKKEEDCTQAGAIQGPTTIFGSKDEKDKKEESIQGVANIADKIRQAKAEIEKGNEFDYDGFVSEIKQDTMRLPEKSEQETAATLLQDFCKGYKGRTADKDNQEIERESKEVKIEYYKMPDNEHIIWDSEVDYYDEEYMNDIKENQYQDYLDNFEPSVPTFEEWLDDQLDDLVGSGAYETADEALEDMRDDLQADYEDYIETYKDEPLDFDTWYSNYISDSSYEDWELLEEDLLDNIFPHIDEQVNDGVLVLSGYYGSNYPDFKSSGAGGKLFTDGTGGFRDYMGGFDRVCITTQNGILGAICNDHDGTVSGQFYTLPDDKTELIKALGYEDIIKERYDEEDLDRYDEMDLMETEFNNDLMYEGIDARDLTEHLDLLKPIKDTISGYTPDPEGTKTESKKTEAMNGFNSENSTAQQLYDDFVEFEDIDKDKWNKSTAEERIEMVRPQVIKFYKQNRAKIDDNWEDFMELLEYWNYHTEYKIFNDLAYDEILDVNENKKIESKDIKTENKSDVDLEELAKDLLDWYGSDMGNWFDEIQGNEEDIYNDLLGMLENVDKEQLTNIIQDIKEADIDDETAKACGFATTSSLLNRLNKVYNSDIEVKTENNKIPRNWKKITYKSKIDTNVDSVGDTIEVERDEWNRPIATNLRTGKTALMFLDMLRNDELSEIINIETADKETESKRVECKELKTESVSYQDLVIAGESLWRGDARIYDTRVEGIYDCQTAGHGGYLVDTDVFPELAKYGDKTPIDNIVGFEEDYEALKVIWAVPEVLEQIQLDKDWYKNLTLDDVLRYDDKLNDDFRKEFPNKKEIAEVPEMKTEAEDMTQVKDDIETAVEKSDSTDLEIDQVKGSLDVLKTDEESAIDGYEEFNKETAEVVDTELADAVKDQMEEIIDDEKEHIEKIDTIKKSLGEFKQIKTESKYVVEYRISDTGEVVKSEPFENFIDAMQYQGNILKKMKDKIDYCKYINVDDDKEVKEEELFGVSDEVKADSKAKGLYTETEDKDFKVGDKVKIDYISDANEYNGQTGTLTMVRKYKYYPNGNADEFEYKTQGTIKFDDGKEFNIPDLNREGSGIVSPVDKVEEEMTLVESYDNEKDADVISKALARKGCKTKVECVDNKYQVWSNK